jgi:predicted porin
MTESKGGRRAAWTRALLVGTVLSGAVIAAPMSGARADTQDEINALKAENAELREMVKSLSQDVKILQNSVNSAVETSQKAAAPVGAPEKMVKSGKSDVELSISGQVDRMMLWADNGNEAQLFNADNNYSSSRVRFEGRANINDDMKAGANIEVEIKSNSSDDVEIGQERAQDRGTGFEERKIEAFFDSKQLGKVTLGQGDTASNGITEIDLSGTQVIAGAGYTAIGGSIEYLRESNKAGSGFTPDDLNDSQDGLSRDDRIRYDSPSLAGFVASTSWIDADTWDLALRYENTFGEGWGFQAGLGYWDASARSTGFTGWGGSAAVLAPFGTNLAAAYSTQDFDVTGRDDTEFWYVKLGQNFTVFDFGETSVSVDYSETADQDVNHSDGSYWSLALVQYVKKAATEIFFNVGQYGADVPGAGGSTIGLEDITFAGLGARVKF